jgi:hypothetical protein
LCDQIGLLVYEENLAAWLLADSPKMAERFDAALREMVRRDRNHPSVVIFGLVNEMKNGSLVQHAVASLGLLRSLDQSRLVLQQSGRWDGQYNVGSVCNPGSAQWEHVWGVENPGYQGTARSGPWGGYFQGAGDAHVYPSTPHTPAIEAGIRSLGKDSKPVFLSEYGVGSLMGPDGIAWERKLDVLIPQTGTDADGPLAVPVFCEEISIPGPTGQYTFAATLDRGGAPAAGRLTFRISEAPKPKTALAAAIVGLDSQVRMWLGSHQILTVPLEKAPPDECLVILVGNAMESPLTPELRVEVLRRVVRGSTVVFLDSSVFRKANDPVGWLPLKKKGRLTTFNDWLYHKECIAKKHPLFADLAPHGIMDWDFYGPVISNRFFEGQDTPEDTAAAAFAICHSSRPDGYAAGLMLGAYRFGAGRIVLNTFNLLGQVDNHPAADRLLLNLVAYAANFIKPTQTALPADFDFTLKELGY